MIRDITPQAVGLIRELSSFPADRYVSDILLPGLFRGHREIPMSLDSARESLDDAYGCLEAVFSHYAFARRGKDRQELADLALASLKRMVGDMPFETFLRQSDARLLWDAFLDVCDERHRKPMEQLNRGVIAGLAELAQEIYRLDGVGSIAGWLRSGILRTHRIEPAFMRMVDIRGVGPKLCSLLVRDVSFIYGLETEILPIDLLYVQPIDKWQRLLAPYLSEGIDPDAADWVLAGKISKYARQANCSGIRLNMGVTYFGARESRTHDAFHASVHQIITKGHLAVG